MMVSKMFRAGAVRCSSAELGTLLTELAGKWLML
jgi:hypothetical protein